MANSTIDSSDLTKLRSNHHYIDDIRFNVFAPDIVTTVTISATPDENPASSLTVVGDISSVETGQRIIITNTSSNIVTHGIVRLAPSGQTLFINPVSIGDSGYVSESGIHRAIVSGDTVTVYRDRPMFGQYSRIVGSSGSNAFRKNWSVPYIDQNEQTPPLSNCGASQSARVSVGQSASFQLPRFGTNNSFALGSATISSYSWSLPTGVTLQGGYALTDSVIEVDAVAGQHVIDLTVTDSNGKTHTSHCYLFVSDNSTHIDLFNRYLTRIESDAQDINGRTITFTVIGDDVADYLLPCGYVHLQHEMLYNGQSLSDAVDVDTFVGYITDYRYSHDGNYGRATFTAVSPYIYLNNVFMPSQLITEVSNPNNWAEVNSDLSNPRGALQYIRWQCENLFAMHDIDAPYTEPRKLSYEYNVNTISSGLDISAQAILGNVGNSSDGTLILRRNPNFENNTFRNALDVGMTFNADDIIPPFEYPLTVPPLYADVRSGAFSYNGGTPKGYYGVKRWGQGASETVLPNFTVTASEGLDTVLEKVGHLYADQNKTDEQTITLNRHINVVDPAWMIWYRVDVDTEFDPSGRNEWDNVRILPRRVNRTWDNDAQTLQLQIQCKRETFGQVADEWVIGSGQTVVSGGWVTGLGELYTPQLDEYGILPNIAIAVNDSGDGAWTQNFTDANPSWTSLNSFVTGNICDVAWDYNSAFITDGGVLSEPFGMYIVSVSGTTLYIYRVFDIKANTLQVDEITTYTMDDSSTTTSARIQCSADNGTLVLVAWHDQTGVQVGRSTDGGATWSSNIQIGSAITDTDNDNEEIGLYLSGSNQIVTAPDGASDYGTYLATTDGGSFSEITGTIRNTAPNQMITGDNDTTLYVSTNNNGVGTPVANVNFETGGYAYNALVPSVASPVTLIGVVANGNPGNCYEAYPNVFGISDTASSYPLGGFSGAKPSGINNGLMIATGAPLFSNITVTRVEMDVSWDIDFDTSGVTGNYTTELRATSTTFDRDAPLSTLIGTQVLDTWNVTTNGQTITSSGGWQRITFTTSQTNIDQMGFAIGFINTVTPTPTLAYTGTSNSGTAYLRLDNLKTFDASGAVIDPKLYRVTTYTTSPTWTDITPATDSIPRLPYGLGIDIADTNNIEVASTDGTTPKWFSSANTGTSYTDNGVSDSRTFKRIGNVLFRGGNDEIGISFDSGTTFENKRGNLDTVMSNGISEIKNILVLI